MVRSQDCLIGHWDHDSSSPWTKLVQAQHRPARGRWILRPNKAFFDGLDRITAYLVKYSAVVGGGQNRIRIISLNYGLQQARVRKQKIAALTKYLAVENDKLSPDKQYIANLQEHIAELGQYTHQGTMIRSRDQSIIEGEKPTRYFYAQERIKKAKSTITDLTVPAPPTNDNSETNDELDTTQDFVNVKTDEEILTHLHKHFSSIFTKQQLDIDLQDQFLSKIDIKLPESTCRKMDNEITAEEIFRAIMSFQLNKTPGIDGLPIEFYITFWEILGEFFPALLNDIYTNGLLPSIQQRLSIITLIQPTYRFIIACKLW